MDSFCYGMDFAYVLYCIVLYCHVFLHLKKSWWKMCGTTNKPWEIEGQGTARAGDWCNFLLAHSNCQEAAWQQEVKSEEIGLPFWGTFQNRVPTGKACLPTTVVVVVVFFQWAMFTNGSPVIPFFSTALFPHCSFFLEKHQGGGNLRFTTLSQWRVGFPPTIFRAVKGTFQLFKTSPKIWKKWKFWKYGFFHDFSI